MEGVVPPDSAPTHGVASVSASDNVKPSRDWKCKDPNCKHQNSASDSKCKVCKLDYSARQQKRGKAGSAYTVEGAEVTYVSNPTKLYFRSNLQKKDFQKLCKNLRTVLKDGANVSSKVCRDEVYVVKWERDWYRGRVLSVYSSENQAPPEGAAPAEDSEQTELASTTASNHTLLQLIDVGRTVSMPASSLMVLPQNFLKIGPLTSLYLLNNCFLARTNQKTIMKTCNWLTAYLQDRLCKLIVYPASTVNYADVYVDDELLSVKLWQMNIVLPRSATVESSFRKMAALQLKESENSSVQHKVKQPVYESSTFSVPRPQDGSVNSHANFMQAGGSSALMQHREAKLMMGRMRAIEAELDSIHSSCDSTQLYSACKIAKDLSHNREQIRVKSCPESQLGKCLDFLESQRLSHADLNMLLKQGQRIDRMWPKEDEINQFRSAVEKFNINEVYSSLMNYVDKTCGRADLSSGGLNTTESVTAQFNMVFSEYKEWQEQYLMSQKMTDSAYKELCEYMTTFSLSLSHVMDSSVAAIPLLDFTNKVGRLMEAGKLEYHLQQQGHIVNKLYAAVQSEIRYLMYKVKEVLKMEKYFDRTSCQDLDDLSTHPGYNDALKVLMPLRKKPLAKFIQEGKEMSDIIKEMIIRDVMLGLQPLHEVGESYDYLFPENIMIMYGCIYLKDKEKAVRKTALPFPWDSKPPECKNSNLPVTPSTDIFNLGMLIYWLACVGNEDVFPTVIFNLHSRVRDLMHGDPQVRPNINSLLSRLWFVNGADVTRAGVVKLPAKDLPLKQIESDSCSAHVTDRSSDVLETADRVIEVAEDLIEASGVDTDIQEVYSNGGTQGNDEDEYADMNETERELMQELRSDTCPKMNLTTEEYQQAKADDVLENRSS